jgi:hypothetical protein
MSDEELLELAAGIDDLTDVAADVLRREMRDRRLEVKPAELLSDLIGTWRPNQLPKPVLEENLGSGKVALITLDDAIRVSGACDLLEQEGVEVEVRDVSRPHQRRGTRADGTNVQLQLVVAEADKDRAVQILRGKMGLFPLQEVAEPDAMVDDGSVATAGTFARCEDAEDAVRALDGARIWHRIVADPEGTAESEDCYILEVREVDLVRAGDSIASAMKLPEV